MRDQDQHRVLRAINDWKLARLNFGNFKIVYGFESIVKIDEARIWTQSNPGADDDYITNEFLQIEDRNFYVFEKPYQEALGDLVLYLSILVDCECGGSEDCEKCFGEGVYNLTIPREQI